MIDTHPIGLPIGEITLATWWPKLDFPFEEQSSGISFTWTPIDVGTYLIVGTTSLEHVEYLTTFEDIPSNPLVRLEYVSYSIAFSDIEGNTFRQPAQFRCELTDLRSGKSVRGETQYHSFVVENLRQSFTFVNDTSTVLDTSKNQVAPLYLQSKTYTLS